MTCARLWLRLQADAFSVDPPAYLLAVVWRAKGLKVRARNRIAALAGRSPWAYRYWIACKEPPPVDVGTSRATPTVVVIDCRETDHGLLRTLASIPAGARRIVIGEGIEVADAEVVAAPADIAALLPGHGAWLCPIRCGDRLAERALDAYSKAIGTAGGADIIYADDDAVDVSGVRELPHFKPDWNPELFEWHDFLTGACIVRSTPQEIARLPRDGWPRGLVDGTLARGKRPMHVHRVLHHRLVRPQPTVPPSGAKPPLDSTPRVTIIVPTRNRTELLRTCLKGIADTDYPAYDLIIVDNDSDEPDTRDLLKEAQARGAEILAIPGPFNFSKLNNRAAARARGELLCFLNNDVEMPDPNWLAYLVHHAVKLDLGAIGARLLYADGTVQHAGVFTGIGGGAGHAHRHQRHDEHGYFERSRLPQRVSAVTAACLVVERHKFLDVGGFDEEKFAVAFNDVDLCLKLNARGWQSFYEPRATLIHHESRSRGNDRAKANRTRFAEELAALKQKWGTDQACDPYHHPHLSPFCEQFLVSV